MKTRILLMGLMLAFLAVSCNKNQQAVKKLDGQWKLSKYNGTAVPDAQATVLTFTSCKLKTDEICDVSSQTGSQTINYKYLVQDDGKTLVTKNAAGTITLQESTIESLDKTNLKLKYSDGSNQITTEYVKQ
jgi:hypothetical protein